MIIKAHTSHTRPQSEFISDLYIEHGPRDLLGRFFLLANKAVADRGIFLEFSSMRELLRVNQANADSWPPLFPAFNPEFCELNEDNSFCVVGRDENGDIVATQAGRLFDWRNSSFAEAAGNLTLLYDDPAKSALPGEAWTATAPMAADLHGMIAFTGAVWYHPKVRGRGLAALVPRLARGMALARWNVDATVVMMSKLNHSKGLFKRTGHVNYQDGVQARGSVYGDVDHLLFWMKRTDILQEISKFLTAESERRAASDGNAQDASAG